MTVSAASDDLGSSQDENSTGYLHGLQRRLRHCLGRHPGRPCRERQEGEAPHHVAVRRCLVDRMDLCDDRSVWLPATEVSTSVATESSQLMSCKAQTGARSTGSGASRCRCDSPPSQLPQRPNELTEGRQRP